MTFTQGTGYPDWTRVDTLVSDPLIFDVVTSMPANVGYGPFYVGPFPTSKVTLGPSGAIAPMQLVLTWYADQSLTDVVGGFTWNTDSATPVADAISNLGPWLKVNVENPFATSGVDYNLNVVETTANADDSRTGFGKIVNQGFGLPLTAGQVDDIPSGLVTTGPALLYVVTTATNWSAELYGIENGTKTMSLAKRLSGDAAPFIPIAVFLPPQQTMIELVNDDGSSRLFSYTLSTP